MRLPGSASLGPFNHDDDDDDDVDDDDDDGGDDEGDANILIFPKIFSIFSLEGFHS